jgi:hypothetical protein
MHSVQRIEDMIFFSIEGVAHSQNKPNAIMTNQGGNKAQVRKREPAIPDNPTPSLNWRELTTRRDSTS